MDSLSRLNLGLCCINTELQRKKIFCSRTLIRRTFTVEKAKQLALRNIADIIPLIDWNVAHGIQHLRLSSDLFPHFTDSETESYTIDFAKDSLKMIGDYILSKKHRVTFHPGQYNQIGARSPSVFEKTVDDLLHHATILDTMGIENGVMCIHGGGVYGDKEATIRRWVDQFDDLPSTVKAKICIENCEKCYSPADCLEIARQVKIPVIFDNLHYDCYSLLHPQELLESPEDLLEEIVDTWKYSDPVFHLAQQAPSSKVGKHADFIDHIPDYFLELPDKYQRSFSLEVEAKKKEQAIVRLKDKYSL
jgi:UV DNA damage endonuclease